MFLFTITNSVSICVSISRYYTLFTTDNSMVMFMFMFLLTRIITITLEGIV